MASSDFKDRASRIANMDDRHLSRSRIKKHPRCLFSPLHHHQRDLYYWGPPAFVPDTCSRTAPLKSPGDQRFK